jgi:hypothetical protein
MYDRYLGKYTAFASNDDPMVKAIKNDLTRSIEDILPVLEDETKFALEDCLGDCKQEWTTKNLQNVSTKLIALLSGRIFVGLPLSRDEEW